MKEKLFSVCPLHSPTNTISRWNKYTLGNGDIIVKDVNKNGDVVYNLYRASQKVPIKDYLPISQKWLGFLT